jgi:hypothetical protein
MGGHAADARATTRANRGLTRCRRPSARTCKEMPDASCGLDAGLKETGMIMNLTFNADTRNRNVGLGDEVGRNGNASGPLGAALDAIAAELAS